MTPVEIARQALHRLAELGLPPTPENYAAQYREIGGLPPPALPAQPVLAASPPAAPSSPQTLEIVRTLLQVMGSANNGLHADLTRFSDESSSLLAQLDASADPRATQELFRAMTASSSWLLGQVDNTRKELERTRAQIDGLQTELERAQALAVSDPLTGLPNRRALDVALAREIARARRHKTPLCVAVLDIDHFKRINDAHGHAVGDRALQHLASVLKTAVRETDVLARFGGEEFVLVMPDTPLVGAEFTMNRLLRTMQRSPLSHAGKEVPVAFSAGLAEWQLDEGAELIVKRADEAMYRAKAAGRGQVMVAETQGAPH
jgi:diguanylate cyclase